MKIYDPVAGGAALVVIDVDVVALAVFKDPATGEVRLACGGGMMGRCASSTRSPVARRCFVLDVGSAWRRWRSSLTRWRSCIGLKMGTRLCPLAEARAATSPLRRGDVRVFDPVAGGEALIVFDVDDSVKALAVFDATRRRARRGSLVDQ